MGCELRVGVRVVKAWLWNAHVLALGFGRPSYKGLAFCQGVMLNAPVEITGVPRS